MRLFAKMALYNHPNSISDTQYSFFKSNAVPIQADLFCFRYNNNTFILDYVQGLCNAIHISNVFKEKHKNNKG